MLHQAWTTWLVPRGETWAFLPTAEEGAMVNFVGMWVSVACAILSALVCIWAAVIYANKKTRHHLEKYSSRLLIVCVAITVVYSVAVALTTLTPSTNDAHTVACTTEMWFVIWSFNFVNWLQGCISLNLIFALYRPQIFRKKVMAWYYTSALAVSVIIATVPAFLGAYRYRPTQYSCWAYYSADPISLDYVQLAIIEVPLVLITVVMFVSWGMVAASLFTRKKSGDSTKEMLAQLYEPKIHPNENVDLLHGSDRVGVGSRFEITERDWFGELPGTPPKKKHGYGAPSFRSSKMITSARWKRSHSSPRHGMTSPSSARSFFSDTTSISEDCTRPSHGLSIIAESDQSKDAPKVLVARLPMVYDAVAPDVTSDDDDEATSKRKLRNTIIRISLYPLMHLFIAVVGAAAQILLENAEAYSRSFQRALYTVSVIGAAWVPLAYSLCAIFADISLWEATLDWIRLRKEASQEEHNLDLENSLGRNAHLTAAARQKIKESPPLLSGLDNSQWLTTHIEVRDAQQSAVMLDLIEEDAAAWSDEKHDDDKDDSEDDDDTEESRAHKEEREDEEKRKKIVIAIEDIVATRIRSPVMRSPESKSKWNMKTV